jgi:predicted TPR repeat methyltransferase
VLDIGSGRGEFLDLLEEAGIECRGVDIDPGMVARCHEKGHGDVAEADALDHLRSLGEHSIGCIFSAQVIEHLEYGDLRMLLERSIEVLRPGGLLIAETVNPHSARALKTFWVDPTHRSPLFPETMLALCQLAGYASAHVFCPNGSGDWESDRVREGEYAILAKAPELHADGS